MKPFSKKIAIILIIILSINISGCKENPYPISKTIFCFDTYITLTIYDYEGVTPIEQVMSRSFDSCKSFEEMLSKTIKTSDVYKINNDNMDKFKVSEPTAEIISHAIEYSQLTNGIFDITIAPLVSLWDVTGDNPTVPDKDKIKSALKKINYNNLEVTDDYVLLKNPDTQIDLGAIAKGYIADRLKDSLVDSGVKSAIIDLGGNILAIGSKNENTNFKIGIKKPFGNEDEKTFATVEIKDKSVVTSGIYERYFEENGKIYHHILDTKTGYPVENDLYSVTVISDSSEDGDALSTSLLSLGYQKGIELLNTLDKNIEAIFITKDYEIILTNGLTIDDDNNILLVLD